MTAEEMNQRTRRAKRLGDISDLIQKRETLSSFRVFRLRLVADGNQEEYCEVTSDTLSEIQKLVEKDLEAQVKLIDQKLEEIGVKV